MLLPSVSINTDRWLTLEPLLDSSVLVSDRDVQHTFFQKIFKYLRSRSLTFVNVNDNNNFILPRGIARILGKNLM